MTSSRFFRIALVLGLLSVVGPFAIDMYLPALPEIGSSLGAPIGSGQPPLYFGLGLFALASIGCALATDIHLLDTHYLGLVFIGAFAMAGFITYLGALIALLLAWLTLGGWRTAPRRAVEASR